MTDSLVMNHIEFEPLSNEDVLLIDGGAWSWSDFGQWTGNAAVAGGITGGGVGAVVGSVVPGSGTIAGTAAGAGIGFVGGAVIGAVGYSLFGWW